MPAVNMGQDTTVPANPSDGSFVIMDAFSGPKGSPLDAKSYDPTTQLLVADPTNYSTGAVCTGIGFGGNHVIGLTAPQSIIDAGFDDDYIPGVTLPDGTAITNVPPVSPAQTPYGAALTTIGGGKSAATEDGIAATEPYDLQPVLGFGEGGSRDAGAGPAFTGFAAKMVTATGAVANGADIEVGFANRSGVTMATGESAFGSDAAASPIVE